MGLRFVLPSVQGRELTYQPEEMNLGCVRFSVISNGSQVLGDKRTQKERGEGRGKERLAKGGREGEGKKGERGKTLTVHLRPLEHVVQTLPF